MPVSGEEKLYDSVIRLHVLANSNEDYDQELKLKVRDAILEKYAEELLATENIKEASERVEFLLEDIEATSERVIEDEGYSYSVKCFFDREYYPERVYEKATFPAGNYLSLRVVIGEGEGKNWWCVLFPPLCLTTAYGDTVGDEDSIPVGLTPEQYKLITKTDDVKYVLKFKMLEILESIFENR
jgi:stage II sporulation protein R